MPKIDCIILDRKDKPPKGGGEPAIVPMSAVIGNAIHAVEPIQGLRTDGIVLYRQVPQETTLNHDSYISSFLS